MEGWSRVDHLRHPIISRQERRHSLRRTLGPTAPFQGPEKCPTPRMPDAGWKSARLSEHLQRTRTNPTHQSCFLTPIQTRRVNTALHLKNSSTGINRYFQIVINRKVVASYSRDTHPFRHRNGDTLSEEHWDQQHPSRPRELPDDTDAGYRYDPPLWAPPTSGKLSKLNAPSYRSKHAVSTQRFIWNSSTGIRSVPSNC